MKRYYFKESNALLTAMVDAYCDARGTVWGWFFGWKGTKNGLSCYLLSKRAMESIMIGYQDIVDWYELEKGEIE